LGQGASISGGNKGCCWVENVGGGGDGGACPTKTKKIYI
jgi:hypothetical protein